MPCRRLRRRAPHHHYQNTRTQPLRNPNTSTSGGTSLTAAPAFRILATMNPGGDYGKRELSPALRSRFTEIWVPPLRAREDVEAVVLGALAVPRPLGGVGASVSASASLAWLAGECVCVVGIEWSWCPCIARPNLNPTHTTTITKPPHTTQSPCSPSSTGCAPPPRTPARPPLPPPPAGPWPSPSATSSPGPASSAPWRRRRGKKVRVGVVVGVLDTGDPARSLIAELTPPPPLTLNHTGTIMPSPEAFIHGAELVFLDGLGLGLGASATTNAAVAAARARARRRLLALLPEVRWLLLILCARWGFSRCNEATQHPRSTSLHSATQDQRPLAERAWVAAAASLAITSSATTGEDSPGANVFGMGAFTVPRGPLPRVDARCVFTNGGG